MNYRILIVDDEKNIRDGLRIYLEEYYEIFTASNGKEAIKVLQEIEIDLVLSDLRMAPIRGEQLLQHIILHYPTVPVIILTAHGSVESAVGVIHKGAYDFITKPINMERLLILLKRALQTRELSLKNRVIQEQLDNIDKGNIGVSLQSRVMQKIMEKVKHVASVNSSVLITGESGVGKEVVCNRIHQLSNRSDKPLINVHCAALSESLLESELFGHEKGAFTDAIAQKKGRFELADGGTIFLDEIGEIDSNIQVKLLRVLQQQEFERVGGEKTIKVDVRVIAATNKNLLSEVAQGNFREDLYYRLSVVNIEVPPLRDRSEDIILLAHNFLQEFNRENNKSIKGFSKEVSNILIQYQWPGNIRELKNCVESSAVMSTSQFIEVENLPHTISQDSDTNMVSIPIGSTFKEFEKEFILATLHRYKWNKSKVSDILGLGRKTLYNKINEYGLEPDE